MDTNERTITTADAHEEPSVTDSAERLSRFLSLDARRYDSTGRNTI